MYYKFYLLLIVVNHCKMFWKPIYLDKFLFMFFFKIYQNLIERYFKRYLTSECSSLFIAYCLWVWSSIVSKFKMQCSIALHRYSSPSFIHLHTGKNKKTQQWLPWLTPCVVFLSRFDNGHWFDEYWRCGPNSNVAEQRRVCQI